MVSHRWNIMYHIFVSKGSTTQQQDNHNSVHGVQWVQHPVYVFHIYFIMNMPNLTFCANVQSKGTEVRRCQSLPCETEAF